ncbi:MAG: outer membrane beta-barrel protein [Alphaproteobacteria bacterium]
MACAVLGAPPPVAAQAVNLGGTARENQVTSRDRPDFEPLGLDFGTILAPFLGGYTSQTLNAITVRPRFEVVQEFNDNIFNQADRGVGDKIVHFKPALSLGSDFENHAITAFFDADRGRYYENRQENYTDYNVGTKTTIQVLDETSVTAGYTFSKKHEIGNAPLDPAVAARGGTAFGQIVTDRGVGITNFDQHLIELGAVLSQDPLILRVDTAARRSSYQPKLEIENEDRNIWQFQITPRIGYQFFEDTTFYIQPQYARRIYDAKFDRSGNNNNGREKQLLFGVTYDFSDLTFAEISGGVVHSQFDDRRFKPSTGFTFDATLIWNSTDLSTFTFRALRSNLATTDTETKTVATQHFSIGLDYEALDNLILTGVISYTNSEYLTDLPAFLNGVQLQNRTDDQFQYQAGLRYLIGPNISATANYTLLDRKANFRANKLTKNRWLFGLAAQL